MNKVIFIMGVSGSGKSTIGKLLSEEISIPFFDGDDYHPNRNIAKMSKGQALNDDDRKGWLESLNDFAKKELNTNSCIIACSALKQKYRDILSSDIVNKTNWVFLSGSFEHILKRINSRENHFMPSKLLKSQFDILEEPKEALQIDINQSPENIIGIIKRNYSKF